MATPPADGEQTVMFSVPSSWPDGDYVAYVEVNTEGDYNATFNTETHPTSCLPYGSCSGASWDSWAVNYALRHWIAANRRSCSRSRLRSVQPRCSRR